MKKSQEQKRNADKKLNIIFICLGIIFFLALAIYNFCCFHNDFRLEKNISQYYGKQVPDSIICMVANKIIPGIPDTVTIEGKLYRGCCSACISKLKFNIKNSRFAIDPCSKQTIIKARAYKVASDGLGHIGYFESEGNFKKYSNHKCL